MSDSLDWDDAPRAHGPILSYLLHGLKILWDLTAVERPRIVTALSVLVVAEVMGLGVPLVFKELVDYMPTIGTQGITPHVFVLGGLLIAAQIATLGIRRFIQEPIFGKALIRLENYWPRVAQEKLLSLSIGYHESENTGRKIAKVNKGVEKLVGMFGDLFWTLAPALIALVCNGIIVLVMDWKLGLIFVLPLLPAFWIHLKSFERFRSCWEIWESKKEESIGLFCQSIINVRTVQSFVSEEREAEAHGSIRLEMEQIDRDTYTEMQRYFFAMETIVRLSFVATIVVGLYFCYRGWSTLGTVTYIAVTGTTTTQQLWSIVQVYSRMVRDLISAERLHTLLHEDVEVANAAKGTIPVNGGGALAFENVSLVYPEKKIPLFDRFNLAIIPGEMFALVGKSGSGKSSLVSLLLRVYDPTAGSITIDGTDIRTVDRDWYRRRFAYVPQDVEIFDGTIKQNIVYAYPDADEDRVKKAVKAACLDESLGDLKRFPHGLETSVGERGVRLSGGERQRVGIARAYVALLSGAQVLVLDEATSSLDSESEQVVQQFIGKLRRERSITIIAIAHRLSTIQQADRICVLESGALSEMGTHEQLLKRNGLYQKLVALQQLGELSE